MNEQRTRRHRSVVVIGALATLHFTLIGGWHSLALLDEGPNWNVSDDADSFNAFYEQVNEGLGELPLVDQIGADAIEWPLYPMGRASYLLRGGPPLTALELVMLLVASTTLWTTALYGTWHLTASTWRRWRAR